MYMPSSISHRDKSSEIMQNMKNATKQLKTPERQADKLSAVAAHDLSAFARPVQGSTSACLPDSPGSQLETDQIAVSITVSAPKLPDLFVSAWFWLRP